MKTYPLRTKETCECFYCHKPGHMVADCLTLKRKQDGKNANLLKPVSLVKTVYEKSLDKVEACYQLFVCNGFVSLTGEQTDQKPMGILRDTGAAQSFILAGVLPLSEHSSCGASVIVQGIEMGFVPIPLHTVHLNSDLASGVSKWLYVTLLVSGVTFILGNDIAGERMHPVLNSLCN